MKNKYFCTIIVKENGLNKEIYYDRKTLKQIKKFLKKLNNEIIGVDVRKVEGDE